MDDFLGILLSLQGPGAEILLFIAVFTVQQGPRAEMLLFINIASLYSNLTGHCYTERLSAASFESSATALQKTCLPRTGAKKIN